MLVLFFYVLFFILIGMYFSKIELEINKLNFEMQNTIDEISKKVIDCNDVKKLVKEIFLKNVKMDIEIRVKLYSLLKIFSINLKNEKTKYKIYINLLKIKIDISKFFEKSLNKKQINKEVLVKLTNYIKKFKKTKILHSNTNLKIILGTGDVFITSIIIPIFSNIIIKKIVNKEIPKISILPEYSEKITLKLYLKTILQFRIYNILKIMNKKIEKRKNNIKSIV